MGKQFPSAGSGQALTGRTARFGMTLISCFQPWFSSLCATQNRVEHGVFRHALLTSGTQERECIGYDADFSGKRAQQFAIGLYVNSGAWCGLSGIRGNGQVLACDLCGVREIDARGGPRAAQKGASYIGKIRQAAGGAAEDEAQVIASERGARSEFLNYSAKIADAHAEKFGEIGALAMIRAFLSRSSFERSSFGVHDLKARHGVGKPQMPGFGVVGGHAETPLGSGAQLVEEMGVDADTSGDHEVAVARLAFKIDILNAADSHAAEITA